MTIPELTLVIQDNHQVQAQKSDSATAYGDFGLTDVQYRLVEFFADWLAQGKITERHEMELFGALMYRALINGDVQGLLNQALGQLLPDERLRIQLSFQKDTAKLASLPWEFLYLPDSETRAGFFLATSDRLVLSRYIPLQTGRADTLKPDKPPLRILFAVTQAAKLNIGASQPVIEAAQQLAASNPITVKILEDPHPDNLLDTLLDYQPHVFHFITRARFDQARQEGEIALLGQDKSADWVEDKNFADFFTPLKGMTRLIFLQSSGGAVAGLQDNFAGLAPHLIRANAQAVVAMQHPITALGAATLARAVLSAIAARRSRSRRPDQPVAYEPGGDDKAILSRDFGAPVSTYSSRTASSSQRSKPSPPVGRWRSPPHPTDVFTVYETALSRLLARLGQGHVRYMEALVYQQRLLENVGLTRLYGDTETRRAERAEVIARLNGLTQAELEITFNTLGDPSAAAAGI